jgi:uncharacterized protein YjiS (DUF1127 family)
MELTRLNRRASASSLVEVQSPPIHGLLLCFLNSGNKTLKISKRVSQITIQNVSVEAVVQKDGLRLSKLNVTTDKDKVSTKDTKEKQLEIEQYEEKIATIQQEILAVRRDLDLAKETVPQDEERCRRLLQKWDEKRKQRNQLEDHITSCMVVDIKYNIHTTGSSKLCRPGENTAVDFLNMCVSWCLNEPSKPVDKSEPQSAQVFLESRSVGQIDAKSNRSSTVPSAEKLFCIWRTKARSRWPLLSLKWP